MAIRFLSATSMYICMCAFRASGYFLPKFIQIEPVFKSRRKCSRRTGNGFFADIFHLNTVLQALNRFSGYLSMTESSDGAGQICPTVIGVTLD